MEKEIRGEFADIEVAVSEGALGEFSVHLDKSLIFSKKEGSCCENRFPYKGEINMILRRLKP